MGHWHDLQSDLRGPTRELRDKIPDVFKGFAQMHSSSLADGALSARAKELIALAIAVAERCDGCIASHAKGAVRHGATPDEVAEMLGVTLMMGGGPATIYAPLAWDAYQEYLAEKSS